MQGTLEEEVVNLLKARKMTVTTVESCTGGLLGAALVNVAGASDVFKQGYITYSEEAKHALVGVKKSTLEEFTAVSEETAKEMAEGGFKAAGADACLSVTGIAGPDGGSEEKPVGLVYIGCCVKGKTVVGKYLFQGNRREVREQAVVSALELLSDFLTKEK